VIHQRDLRARAAEWALREDVVEKDYVLGWVLAGIGTEPKLREDALLAASFGGGDTAGAITAREAV